MHMKVLKFGGKSLSNGQPLSTAIDIIKEAHLQGSISVVVSALSNSTDKLIKLYELAVSGDNFDNALVEFLALQNNQAYNLDLNEIFTDIVCLFRFL